MKNKPLHTQQISNSPIFPEIEREINIISFIPNSDSSTFDIYYRISYYKDEQDVSSMFNAHVPVWHIDNSKNMMVRDANFRPIYNPDFVEERDQDGNIINENERFKTMPAYDYIIKMMLEMNIPIKSIISAYIAEEDRDGRFNF